MKILIYSVLAFYFLLPINSLVYTIDERIRDCNNGSTDYLDYRSINFTMISDTETVANGKLIFLKNITNNWRFEFFGERYDRGQWNLMFQKKMDNFCNHLLNPTELWYLEAQKVFKGKGCPIQAGFELNFVDYLLEFKALILPPHWTGEWRIIIHGSLLNYPEHYTCVKIYATVFDN